MEPSHDHACLGEAPRVDRCVGSQRVTAGLFQSYSFVRDAVPEIGLPRYESRVYRYAGVTLSATDRANALFR